MGSVRAATLAAGQRMAADVSRRVDSLRRRGGRRVVEQSPHLVLHRTLDARGVRDCAVVMSADVRGDDLRRAPRRYRNNGDIDGLTRVNVTRAERMRLVQMDGADIGEPDRMAALTQGKRDRRSDQSRSDD